jgi:AbrB family looped-hinge helix DNA binding protein
MKATATLTSKGQITIPKAVRQSLGLQTGDALEFEVQEDRVELRAARPRRTSAGVLRRYLPKGWKAPSVDSFDRGIAQHLGRRHTSA